MKKAVRRMVLAAAVALAGGALGARAEGMSIAAKMGTLGLGVEVTGWINEYFNLRGGGYYLAFDYDREIDDVDYETEVRLSSGLFVVDWHPSAESEFRITGGLFINNNEAELFGSPDEKVDIGDGTYLPAQVGQIHGRATFPTFAPYFGVGYGNEVADGSTWTFSFDLGVVFQGSPRVSLDADGPVAGSPDFQANLEKEEQNAEDDLEGFRIYPVVTFGVAYYFW